MKCDLIEILAASSTESSSAICQWHADIAQLNFVTLADRDISTVPTLSFSAIYAHITGYQEFCFKFFHPAKAFVNTRHKILFICEVKSQ